MAMTVATKVNYEGSDEFGKKFLRTIGDCPVTCLILTGFENGIVTVNPEVCSLSQFTEAVVGCFASDSNFESEVLKAYECDNNTKVKGVRVVFNGITVDAVKETISKNALIREFDKKIEARYKKEHLAEEEWLKTPEGKAYLVQLEEDEKYAQIVIDVILYIDNRVEMEFKDSACKKVWDELLEKNSEDFFEEATMIFAGRWAKYMQMVLHTGENIADIAHKTSLVCNIEGIPETRCEQAVDYLIKYWRYGEELQKAKTTK